MARAWGAMIVYIYIYIYTISKKLLNACILGSKELSCVCFASFSTLAVDDPGLGRDDRIYTISKKLFNACILGSKKLSCVCSASFRKLPCTHISGPERNEVFETRKGAF